MHAVDTSLQPKSALASRPETADGWTGPGLAIAELRNISLAFVLARPQRTQQLRAAVIDELGIGLPDDLGVSVGRRVTLVSCAPGTCLAVMDANADSMSVATLRQRLAGLAEVVDCSDNFTLLSVGGSRTQAMLARACAIDLEGSGLPAPLALVTLMFQIRTYLWRQTAAGPYTMMIPRSLAVCFWDALMRLAQSQDIPAQYHQRL